MLRVGYQGVPGAWGEDAILALLGEESAAPLAFDSFELALGAVFEGRADAAVIPVANSIVGAIGLGVDAIAAFPGLRTIDEVDIAIDHCLLALPGASLRTLRRVESHPVALAQCLAFLRRQTGLVAHQSFDTAGAARDVARRGDRSCAAIAGPRAAVRYGLSVVADRIADREDNRTRFVAMAK